MKTSKRIIIDTPHKTLTSRGSRALSFFYKLSEVFVINLLRLKLEGIQQLLPANTPPPSENNRSKQLKKRPFESFY